MPNETAQLNNSEVSLETLRSINNLLAESDKRNGQVIATYANAFGIPYWGIVMYQDKPYINSLGLEWKWFEHPEAIELVNSEIISLYDKPGEGQSAIVRITGKSASRGLDTQIGTSMQSNTTSNMSKYPNELAETRAKNRLLRRALSPYFYRDFYQNINSLGRAAKQLLKTGKITDMLSTSAEELSDTEDTSSSKPIVLTNADYQGITSYIEAFTGAKTDEDVMEITKKIKSDKKLNEKQKEKLRQIRLNTLEKLG